MAAQQYRPLDLRPTKKHTLVCRFGLDAALQLAKRIALAELDMESQPPPIVPPGIFQGSVLSEEGAPDSEVPSPTADPVTNPVKGEGQITTTKLGAKPSIRRDSRNIGDPGSVSVTRRKSNTAAGSSTGSSSRNEDSNTDNANAGTESLTGQEGRTASSLRAGPSISREDPNDDWIDPEAQAALITDGFGMRLVGIHQPSSMEFIFPPSVGPSPGIDETENITQNAALAAINDPDAIEVAPPRLDPVKKDPGDAEITRISSQDPDICDICATRFGEISPITEKREVKAYLPCGHFFGHGCLFWNMGEQRGPMARCPRGNCISLRHICCHPAIPSTQAPIRSFNDTDARQLPWLCEYCNTKDGRKIHDELSDCEKEVQIFRGEQQSRIYMFKVRLMRRWEKYDDALERRRCKLDKRFTNWFSWKMQLFEKVKKWREDMAAKDKKEGEKQENKDMKKDMKNKAGEEEMRRREQAGHQAARFGDPGFILSRFNRRQMSRLRRIPEVEEDQSPDTERAGTGNVTAENATAENANAEAETADAGATEE
ncbi:hypothetical protein BGZ63DRAFT_404352 [Mariannaea sp. PMI_226]|nr:hypothetical protein BGZ63DRAFT_404352 [Mariannaea sp. PMI_226]